MKFTWTGLFVLLALVAVVAAVAIPSYGDYAHRAQASEAIGLMSEAKTPLAEFFANNNRWPESLDKVKAATEGKYTQSVAITRGAGGTSDLELTATMRTERVDRRVAGQTVHLRSADGGKTWVCRGGTMPAKNLPGSCRD